MCKIRIESSGSDVLGMELPGGFKWNEEKIQVVGVCNKKRTWDTIWDLLQSENKIWNFICAGFVSWLHFAGSRTKELHYTSTAREHVLLNTCAAVQLFVSFCFFFFLPRNMIRGPLVLHPVVCSWAIKLLCQVFASEWYNRIWGACKVVGNRYSFNLTGSICWIYFHDSMVLFNCHASILEKHLLILWIREL